MATHKSTSEAQQFIAKRRVARRLAMIGTYQWLMTKNDFREIYLYFQEDEELSADFRRCDAAFFHKLLRSALEESEAIEAQLIPFLNRNLAQVDPIEHAILRVATAELLYHPETPYKVIVNESVNLTKKFGAEKAHKFINGMLDRVASVIREQEINTR